MIPPRDKGPSLARIAYRFSTAETNPPALTTHFLPFDLDVTRHAAARKPANKYRHISRLRSLATKPGEISGLVPVAESVLYEFVTQGSPTRSFALKGQSISAQGNALGMHANRIHSAESAFYFSRSGC